MFQILGISYVGWICAWWSTINIWCVYVLDMGVCASSGSVGFWPIIPAALRSQLRSHAHIWHSFLDMITIHLPLRVWLCGIFPSFPSGTGATFQKWTARPTAATTPYSLVFILSLPPHCLLLVQPPSTDSCCFATGILWYNPFPPWVSCLCLQTWLGHLAVTSFHWPPARIGKEGEGWGDKMSKEATMKLYLTTACCLILHDGNWLQSFTAGKWLLVFAQQLMLSIFLSIFKWFLC